MDLPELKSAQTDMSPAKLGQISQALFKVDTDISSGSGWLAAEGWLVTSQHVVHGATWINAISVDGKNYKLGDEIIIDEANDLALIKFIDPPKNVTALKLAKSIQPDKRVWIMGFPGQSNTPISSQGERGEPVSRRTFYESLSDSLAARIESNLANCDEATRLEARRFLNSPLVSARISTLPGSSGSPLFDSSGSVVGLHYGKAGEEKFFVPLQPIEKLMAQRNEGRRFGIHSRYKPAPWVNNLSLLAQDSPVLMTATSLAATAVLTTAAWRSPALRRLAPLSAGAAALALMNQDLTAWLSSTNHRDRTKHGLALLGNTATTLGAVAYYASYAMPKLRLPSIVCLSVGLTTRLGAETVPNNLIIGGISRSDGSSRPIFSEDILLQRRPPICATP